MNERQQCQNWNAAADWSMKDGFGPQVTLEIKGRQLLLVTPCVYVDNARKAYCNLLESHYSNIIS